MKVLITGGTGTIGKQALLHALLRPEITSVVALSRKELPTDISNNSKLKVIILKDFNDWSQDILEEIKDADAMIWALGTSDNSRAANLDYPLAFQNSIIKVLEPRTGKALFRYIHLSGKFVEQDQDRSLWLLPVPRKIKGIAEVRSIEFANAHSNIWQAFIVRPGGVLPKAFFASGTMMAMAGGGWFIGGDELGAFMADLAIKGEEKETIILNPRLVEKGKELLLDGK